MFATGVGTSGRWWTLSYRTQPTASIEIKVYSKAVPHIETLLQKSRGPEAVGAHYARQQYVPALTIGGGFDTAITSVTEQGHYRTLSFPLRTEKLLSTALSLHVLLEVLTYYPNLCVPDILDVQPQRDMKLEQLLQLTTAIPPQSYQLGGAGLYGRISSTVLEWTRHKYTNKDTDWKQLIMGAMRSSYEACTGRTSNVPDGCCEILLLGKGRGFALSTVGNACDLSTDDWWSVEHGDVCDISPHNVDSIEQQLSLMVGLGSLLDMVDTKRP